jgi:hypothetical protein
MFKHADPDSYVSLRGLPHERGARSIHNEAVLVGDLAYLIDRAVYGAGITAEAKGVFAPPVATFSNPAHAREVDLAEGLTISVDIDSGDTGAKRDKLTAILGEPTMVVASGGEWIDADTGVVHDKLHVHWRLAVPTRTPEDHARLADARRWAVQLVDSDRTGAPVPHPFRWPGTLHLKGEPRFARIVAESESEIDLDTALEALHAAGVADGLVMMSRTATPHATVGTVEEDIPANIARFEEVCRHAEKAVPGGWHAGDVALACRAVGLAVSCDAAKTAMREFWVPRGEGFHDDGRDQRWEGDVEAAYAWARTEVAYGSETPQAGFAGVVQPAAEHDASAEIAVQVSPEEQATGGRHRTRMRSYSPSECGAVQPAPYLIKGILARGQVALVAALPGQGKSCFVPLLAYKLAQGETVFGRRTRPGPVDYFGLEDGAGMVGRIEAHRLTFGDAPTFRLHIDVGNLLTSAEDREAVLSLVRARRSVLVVLDTVRAGWRGLKENDADQMGAVVAFARELAADVDAEPGPAVVVVHHTTKAGGQTSSGSGVLEADVDVSLFLAKDPETNIATVSFGKNRNGEAFGQELCFSFQGVCIGEDEDGDPVTRPVAIEVAQSAIRKERGLTPQVKTALVLLKDLVAQAGPGVRACPDGHRLAGIDFTGAYSVSTADWGLSCAFHGICNSSDSASKAKAFKRAKAALLERRLIAEMGDDVFLLADPAQ